MTDSTPLDTWEPFVFRAQVGRSFDDDAPPVVDGDTIWFRIDKGFFDYFITNVRLMDVDTREIHFVSHDSEEYKRGKVHAEFTETWLQACRDEADTAWPFLLRTYLGEQEGKYGRVLAEVWSRSRKESLADALLTEFDDVEVYE